MTGSWPWPNDTKDDRYRRIIDHYRNELYDADLERCLEIDALMAKYGQAWISDNGIIDVNAMMTARELAEKHGLSEWDIRNWERAGHIIGFRSGRKVLFRQGDVLAWRHRAN